MARQCRNALQTFRRHCAGHACEAFASAVVHSPVLRGPIIRVFRDMLTGGNVDFVHLKRIARALLTADTPGATMGSTRTPGTTSTSSSSTSTSGTTGTSGTPPKKKRRVERRHTV